ncbi:MAG: hypothetical protein IT556_14145 [Acetobacteraceae bacterium]|nr:hypothetical protein [Acetobacteraceae bacterium]
MRAILILLLLLPSMALSQARRVDTAPTSETIGSWLLTCSTDPMTDRGSCTLRHHTWLEAPRGGDMPRPGVGLEVLIRGGRAVPALVARDLTLDSGRLAVLGMLASAQVRFGREPMLELPCGLEGRSLVCVPRPGEAETAARQLLAATTMLARLPQNPLTGTGGETLALDLAGTEAAVQRLRARMPEAPPPEPSPAQSLPGQFDRLLDQLRRALPQP